MELHGNEEIVVVKNLVKRYGAYAALKGVTFTIRRGEIFGLIGPNGAGKTTTLRIIATLLKPTSGRVLVGGYDVVKDAERVRKLVSYLPEDAGAYPHLRGYEYLELMLSFYYDDKTKLREALDEAIEVTGLGEKLRDKIKTYSKGMKRRLLLAKTLVVKPMLAILDEPTSGLDVIHAYHVRKLIKEYSRKHGITVLVSSHNMLEVEFLCDRVAILHEGRLLVVDTPLNLKKKFQVGNLEEAFNKIVSQV